MKSKIRTLLFSCLYPSAVRPSNGIFVETRLRELLRTGEVDTRVVAPVPWFPFSHSRFGDYALFARTPDREVRNGIEVLHPRYWLPPKVGMNIAPFTLALGALSSILRLRDEGFDFDLIDAHYYYPDGVAAALLGKWLGKPFVVTARGTDINLIPHYAFPRKLILWAASRAEASISVCRALRDEIGALGADPAKLMVLRNGVDLERFRPIPRAEARAQLDWPGGTTLLSVGYLIERKGNHLIIDALAALPDDHRLVIVGMGPDESALREQARTLGLQDRVVFAGGVPNADLYRYYSAADMLVLASDREGWANVLLEAMACGTPVVATRIWGTPEVVARPEAGRLSEERTPASLAAAIRDLEGDYPSRQDVRLYAEGFGWEETSLGQLELFRKIAGREAGSGTGRGDGGA